MPISLMAALQVHGISYQRGQETVLAQTGFELDAGQLLFVVGNNGSGKTTLMRVLAGVLAAPDAASASWHDEPWRLGDAHHGPATLYIGHQLGIKDDLTAVENLKFYAQFRGQRKTASVQTVLRAVGLDGYQFSLARQLSAGQRKRLALGRLLLCPGELWLLDEPYANLDDEGVVLVDRLLNKHLGEGGLAVVTSHGAYQPPLDGVVTHQLVAPWESP